MLKYSLKRVVLAFVTAFIILTLTFFLVKTLSTRYLKVVSTDENVVYGFYMEQVKLGYCTVIEKPITEHFIPNVTPLDSVKLGRYEYFFFVTPVHQQYFRWLGNIFTKWDWGTSTVIEPGASALNIIVQQLPATVKVNIVSVIVSVPLGIALGILAGLKKNTWVDHLISTLVMVFISIPSFVVISFLMHWLCYQAQILPPAWPRPDEAFGTKVLAYFIPVMSLSFGSICGYTRFVRAELCEVMSSEYLLLARTKGLTKNQAIVRHALRNAFVPILPSILAEFIGVFGGSMILESLYDIPGIGRLYIRALNNYDYNVLMVDMAIFTTVGLLAGIILDLSYGFIDPRIRMGEKK